MEEWDRRVLLSRDKLGKLAVHMSRRADRTLENLTHRILLKQILLEAL